MLSLALVLASRLTFGPAVDVHEHGLPCAGPSLSQRVATLLEGSSIDTDSTPEVETTLDEDAGRWTLSLRWGDQEASRRFEAERCETVLDAAAFVIAVAMDPTVADRVPPPDAEPPEPLEPEPEPLEPEPEPEPVEPEPRPLAPTELRPPGSSSDERPPHLRALRFALGITAGVDGGALPLGAPVGGRVGLLGPRWRVDLRGHYRSASAVEATLDSTVGGRIGGWALGLRGCGRLAPRSLPLELPLCGAVEAGQVTGQGFGFENATSARLPWTALMGETGVVWVFGSVLAVGLEAQLGAGLLGGRLVIDELETLFEIGRFVGRGLLTVELRLPKR